MIAPLPATIDRVGQVRDALREAICAGGLAPGERLTQQQLAGRFGVSRQPVLQALRLLQADGLIVDTDTHRGMLVAPVNAGYVVSLYEVRGAIDALAARAAAAARPDIREAGNDLIRRARVALHTASVGDLALMDQEFHRLLYRHCGNPVLIDLAEMHWLHSRRVICACLRPPAPLRQTWSEHQAILRAVLAGDTRGAERLARRHAEQSTRLLLTELAWSPRAPSSDPRPGPRRKGVSPRAK